MSHYGRNTTLKDHKVVDLVIPSLLSKNMLDTIAKPQDRAYAHNLFILHYHHYLLGQAEAHHFKGM